MYQGLHFSIIIPCFNSADHIESTLDKLSELNYDKSKYEIIVVDDGSTDDTSSVVKRKCEQESNIVLFCKRNSGVSAARNLGIKEAKGKYLLFVDSDDYLSKNSLTNIFNFFERHYFEIDILVYSLKYIWSRNRTKSHWREKYLSDGIYSVGFSHAVLTNINYCIKNDKKYYFDENLSIHEDEEFAIRILENKKSYGFLSTATYLYKQHPNSVTATQLNPYYSFEPALAFYESKINKYKNDDEMYKYIQKVMLNDFTWKLKSNCLLRNTKKHFSKDLSAFKVLLSHIDDALIVGNPNMDIYHKHWLLSLKSSTSIILKNGGRFELETGDTLIGIPSMEVWITKIKESCTGLCISGFFKSALFNHIVDDQIDFYVLKSDGTQINLNVEESLFSRYKQKIKTNSFKKFQITLNEGFYKFCFSYKNSLLVAKTKVYKDLGIKKCFYNRSYYWEGDERSITVNSQKEFSIRINNMREISFFKKILLRGLLAPVVSARNYLKSILPSINIYIDRDGVFDNSLVQFIDDIKCKDSRNKCFYVYCNKEDLSKLKKINIDSSLLIKKGSLSHILCYMLSSNILTSFIDKNFYLPMKVKRFQKYLSFFIHPRVFYLQHGVLHAEIDRYSIEYHDVDYVIVSTVKERNYYYTLGYRDEMLLPYGMAKFDRMQFSTFKDIRIKKIIYLPSWRSYLASVNKNNNWSIDINKFRKSTFGSAILELFSKETYDFLRSNNLTLDVKFHPIFSTLSQQFPSSDVVKIVTDVTPSDYSLVITDYSSGIYDYVYQGIRVLYFCPDIEEFEGGLNLYNSITTPMDNGFGPFAKSVDELLDVIKHVIYNNSKFAYYGKRYDNQFFVTDYSHAERLRNFINKGN